MHHSDIMPGEAGNIRYYYMMVKNAFASSAANFEITSLVRRSFAATHMCAKRTYFYSWNEQILRWRKCSILYDLACFCNSIC